MNPIYGFKYTLLQMHGMVRGITTVQQQKSHSYCLFKSRTKENEKKVYSYIYTKQKQESQTGLHPVEVYWNHNGGSSWFCVWMEGNGYQCHLSHDATWTFRDERIIGLVNAIYEGIFVYILADVA